MVLFLTALIFIIGVDSTLQFLPNALEPPNHERAKRNMWLLMAMVFASSGGVWFNA